MTEATAGTVGPTGRESPRLVDDVVAAVRTHIREHALSPGDTIPSELAFTERLGVSRAVVREAFRSLRALRIIDVANGRRPRVAGLDHDAIAMMIGHGVETEQISIQQIFDVRQTIEKRTAALAALRRTDREADDIVAHATTLRNAMDNADVSMATDIAFHELIARASRNPVFEMIVCAFREVTRQTWPISWRARETDAERLEIVACHGTIAAAIARRDPASAVTAMNDHFDMSNKALIAAGIR